MRNALLLLSMWVAIIVAAYAMVYWDGGVEPPLPIAVLEPADASYADPDGRFSLRYPPAWRLEVAGSSVSLVDPLGRIEVTASSAEEPVPESALLRALGILSNEDDRPSIVVEEIPAPGDAERGVRIIIVGPTDGGKEVYGLAYLYGGETILLVVRGEATAIAAQRDELDRIEAGLAIPAATVEEAVPVEEAAPVVQL